MRFLTRDKPLRLNLIADRGSVMDLGKGRSENGCSYLCPVCTCVDDYDGSKVEIEAGADLG